MPQRCPQVSRIAVLIFVASWIVAMSTYPGWNAFDSHSTGHDVLRNFLCDLLSATTPDGRSNLVGSIAMNAGAVVLVLGALLPLWWQVPLRGPWRCTSRVLGVVAALFTLTICVQQAFALAISHNTVTLSAAAAGLVPTTLLGVTDWRSVDTTTTRRVFLLGTILASLVNFFSYALVQLGSTLTLVVPIAQKVALVCLLAWLFLKPALVPVGLDEVEPTTV